MNFMTILLQSLYLMLPAYLANMAPVIVKKIPFGTRPLDGGLAYCDQPIFGKHKTYRGLLGGILFGMIGTVIQKGLHTTISPDFSLLNYGALSFSQTLFVGFLFGAGALLGDLLKSFFKRRIGITDGRPWILFDQLDFVLGALAALSIVYTPPLIHLLIIIIVSPLLSLLVNIISYALGLKKVWW